jgi:hypothetical protein
MDAAHISALTKVVEVAVGLISIYLGYCLFSDLPWERSRAVHRKVIINLASGTLLALLGMASLMAAAGTARLSGDHRSVRGTTHSLRSPALRNSGHRPQFFA